MWSRHFILTAFQLILVLLSVLPPGGATLSKKDKADKKKKDKVNYISLNFGVRCLTSCSLALILIQFLIHDGS